MRMLLRVGLGLSGLMDGGDRVSGLVGVGYRKSLKRCSRIGVGGRQASFWHRADTRGLALQGALPQHVLHLLFLLRLSNRSAFPLHRAASSSGRASVKRQPARFPAPTGRPLLAALVFRGPWPHRAGPAAGAAWLGVVSSLHSRCFFSTAAYRRRFQAGCVPLNIHRLRSPFWNRPTDF